MTPAELEEQGARVAAFGRWLLQERELRSLSRDEVARLTKLGAGVIESLESGELARMPPRAYLYGYLRAYAGAVGLDADDAVLRWQEAAGVKDEASPAAPRRWRARLRFGLVLLALVLLGALALSTWRHTRGPRTLQLPDRPGRAAERAPYPQP